MSRNHLNIIIISVIGAAFFVITAVILYFINTPDHFTQVMQPLIHESEVSNSSEVAVSQPKDPFANLIQADRNHFYRLRKIPKLNPPRNFYFKGYSSSSSKNHRTFKMTLNMKPDVLKQWLATSPLLKDQVWTTDLADVVSNQLITDIDQETPIRYLYLNQAELGQFHMLINLKDPQKPLIQVEWDTRLAPTEESTDDEV